MFGRKTKLQSKVETATRGYDSYEMRLGDEMRGERATQGKSLLDVERELRIKASYISAIENTDLTAFDSLSFVAGYVRSYARYLGLDPEVTFRRFSEESGFGGFQALRPMDSEASRRKEMFSMPAMRPRRPAAMAAVTTDPGDPFLGASNPFANKVQPVFAGFEPGALGSLAVLGALIAGLGYGGWTVVQEIQRVQVAPVEQAPDVIVELDPLDPAPTDMTATDAGGVEAPSADVLERIYRPKALDVPILTARDEPISTITPGSVGVLASTEPTTPASAATADAATPGPDAITASIDTALAEAMGEEPPATPRVLAEAPDAVVLVAVRSAWVRVRNAEGDTLFEKVLEPGETYEVPASDSPAKLRTGNSGAIYMSVAGQTYGPVAPGPQVANADIDAAKVIEGYAVADLEEDGDLARVVAELSAPVDPLAETPSE